MNQYRIFISEKINFRWEVNFQDWMGGVRADRAYSAPTRLSGLTNNHNLFITIAISINESTAIKKYIESFLALTDVDS